VISHILGIWPSNFDKIEKIMIMVGTAALFWVILRYRNDLIFENCKYSFFTQTVFRGRLDTFLGAVGE
jgi:hypothetical protein